ncbi:Nn.00g062460.m01.CDS01 [Neocucurbitaria sp. VM-36]
MSAPATSDPITQSGATSKSKKKKNKKKGGGGANKAEEPEKVNGNPSKQEAEDHEEDADEEEDQTLQKPATQSADPEADDVDDEPPLSPTIIQTNGTHHHSIASAVALGLSRSRSQQGLSPSPPPPSDTSARLDAIAKERDALRQEVTELRKSLENIQSKHAAADAGDVSSKHEEEIRNLREELDEANEGKEHFETQYKNLLGRVNTIKTSLGDRLKADAARIEEYETQVSELEEQTRELQENNNTLSEDLAKLRQERDAQALELENLRSRSNLSQQNWIKERDELISREAYAREEFENAKQAMQDWEVLAMNERSLRETLTEKDTELRDQLETLKEEYEKAARDRDTNSQAVEGLQKALQEVQSLRKVELKKSVEAYESQINDLRKQVQTAEEASKSAKATVESIQKELERALPFEKEVKEKNLLIGKLRHEAVTLNEHLTKALRILKKGRPEDNVDRQIITNYFLHFLSIDRSDPKKFEALQLISALLGWTDEQREQAGLARPGTSSTASGLRIPLSPFRRTPSTPSLNSISDPMLMASSSSNKESLAELWQDFLEREAAEGKDASRRGSAASPPPRIGSGPATEQK